MRTHETVILEDALSRNLFSADPHIVQHRVRSILCLPLISRAKFIGVLYLENNLTPHVFTTERITVLKVLASQAAVSLENTRLYRDLESREAKIRRLVEANVVGIAMWNLDGAITGANEAFLRMVQYDREDLASGRVRWKDLTLAEWCDRDERAIADLKASGVFQPYEKECFRKDGSRVPVLLGGALFKEGGNEGVAFAVDLSEQKRTEETLRQLEADLAHINRVNTVGELAASLAHEIKQPISAAILDAGTCLEWLKGDQPVIDEAREAASRIIEDVTRASEIINRVRSLFKKGEPQRELTDVNAVIREMIGLLRAEAGRQSIAVGTDLAGDLPIISADRVQLQQVLMNLMLNAMDAIKQRGGAGELTIRSRPTPDHQVLISVSDTGVGLPPERTEKIFDAFFTTKPQGSGMGLSISRSIVESHGGRLWATANPEWGATFQFTLPSDTKAA